MTYTFGIDTFGDVTDDATGTRVSHAQTIRDVVDEGVLADQVGIDAIGIGEHHRDDFAISSPEMVLAAIASRTERITLGSAVTVLSSDDPVRVFERYSTLNAISHGRAEITVGRGSFTESFPLFGYDLHDYESLFEEKLAMFAELLKNKPITWSGQHTQTLRDQGIWPPIEDGALKTWVAVGGSPESVVRAARYDMPLMLAIIGGPHARFAPYADLYRRALEQLGQAPQPVGFHSYGYVAATDEQAREEFFEPYLESTMRIGAERGWTKPTRDTYENEIDYGSMMVGSPEFVAKKIASSMKALGAERFDLKYSTGPLRHDLMMNSLELYGTKVIPMAKDILSES